MFTLSSCTAQGLIISSFFVTRSCHNGFIMPANAFLEGRKISILAPHSPLV